jgi:hypothetical protein
MLCIGVPKRVIRFHIRADGNGPNHVTGPLVPTVCLILPFGLLFVFAMFFYGILVDRVLTMQSRPMPLDDLINVQLKRPKFFPV